MNESQTTQPEAPKTPKVDVFHGALNWVSYNRWSCLAIGTGVILCSALCMGMSGRMIAPPNVNTDWLAKGTPVLTEDTRKVTKTEFDQLVAIRSGQLRDQILLLESATDKLREASQTFTNTVGVTLAQFEEKRAFSEKLVTTLSGLAVTAASGTVNPTGMLVTGLGLLAGLFGVGRHVDAKRKDVIIEDLKRKQ